MRFQRFSTWMLMVAMAAGSGMAYGQVYPAKPVRIIMPYVPGGGTDPVLALFVQRFSKDLDQRFILDHRPGGNTIIGATAAAKAPADGYTLLTATTALLVNHWVYPDLPYNALTDLAPISTLTRSDTALVLHPAFPASDLKEFISYAKANPGKVDVASVNAISFLNYQRFMSATGTKLTIVNYKGGGQAIPDMVAGRIPVFIVGPAAVQAFIKAGKLKALAIAGNKRNPLLPDVPTFAEGGVQDYDPSNWIALFVPSKTPRSIVEKMNAQVRKAQEIPEMIGALDKLGLAPQPTTVAQAEQFIRIEAERFGKAIKESGLKAEDL